MAIEIKVCTHCRAEMRCEKNGQPVAIMAQGRAYQVWLTDVWYCSSCGSSVCLTGEGQKPLWEHFHSSYEAFRPSLGEDLIEVEV